jgi:NADH dehydrogenase [ubiquinone] 1 alpha subcomplex assembly factor 1
MLRGVVYLSPRGASSCINKLCNKIHTSSPASNFWEPDKKGGYRTKIEVPTKEHVRQGLKLMKGELNKFKDEVKCNIRCDSATPLEHGDYEVVWKFDSPSAVNEWVVTSDKDHNEGRSTAEFILGTGGRGIFKGRLDTTVPKDGVIKSSGYCNIRSPSNMVRL